ncbi:YihY/virulence factor BrkB family protein [Miltoncostaea oceani]|uniref:YihY/virulence factor BrkB family protein n=1 Tax=Miltoncostaea oceani TaxID=2843216 RepID=UPI001C3E2503|nr:YihY/virulence factor BrkB family protein [Miltoncostaea oceani]
MSAAPGGMHRPQGVGADGSLWATVRRTVAEFREDGLTDWAAALTYYGLLSLFPALIALASVVGLFADPRDITDVVLEIAPPSAADALAGPIESITTNTGAAGVALVLGLAGALWGASGYIGAFGRASNAIYETREGRPFWKLRPVQIVITLVMVLLIALVTLAIALTGPVVDAVGDALGIGSQVLAVWDVAKWPVLAAVVVLMFTILYWATPNVRPRRVADMIPGVVLSLVVWLAASAGFAFYVSRFASYDRTYGTLGGVVVLLVWLWLTNVALLLGAEFNAERERSAEIRDGVPGATEQIQLTPRDRPDPPRTL